MRRVRMPWSERSSIRRISSRQWSAPTGSARPRATDSRGRRTQRQARPEAEALDPRLLMASGHHGRADAIAVPDLADRVARAGDPWADMRRRKRSLARAIQKLGQLYSR